MITAVRNRILRIGKAIGLEIIFFNDSGLSIEACTSSLKRNSIVRDSFITNLRDINVLNLKLDRKLPVALVLGGKGVITKILPEDYKEGSPVPLLIPNANPDDFYYSIFGSGKVKLVSLIRRQQADLIINKLSDSGFRILECKLGGSAIIELVKYIEPINSDYITTSTFRFYFEKNEGLTRAETFVSSDSLAEDEQKNEYLIGGQYIKGKELMSFAASFAVLTTILEDSSEIPSLKLIQKRKDFKYFLYFRRLSLISISIVFILLLTSFAFYNHFHSLFMKYSANSETMQLSQRQTGKLVADVKQKESFLKNAGWMNLSRMSYYADRLGSLVPAGITLSELNINPVQKNGNATVAISYRQSLIEVQGTCEDPIVLTEFVESLKLFDEFSKVSVKAYQFDRREMVASFVVEIKTR